MSLLDSISSLPDPIKPPSAAQKLEKSVARVKLAFPGCGVTKPDELDALVSRIAAAIEKNDWAGVTEGNVATVIRAMAAGTVVLPSSVQSFLIEELALCTRKTLLGALCDGFLPGWTSGTSRTRWLAQMLVARAAWLPARWQSLFQAVPEALDAETGAIQFGQWLATQTDPYRAVIAKGILAPHETGFMAHVHAAWLAALPTIRDEAAIRRVLAWIIPHQAPALDGDRGAKAVARLLMPWQRELPPDNVQSFLPATLTTAYGDPRKERPEFWILVGDDARKVMLRWLAGRSMEAFIEVVTRAEAGGGHREQWSNRRRFWMGMHKRGRIDEAWVAFTKDAQAIAEGLFRETHDPAYSAFGMQDGSRKDTCLLIMRVGRKIIVEGSHNFRVHVFEFGEVRAPTLYAAGYNVDDIILMPREHPQTKVHDAPGNWMRWVEDKVR